MYKEKVLESIRHLYLDENKIIATSRLLPTITDLERETFEKALLDYSGNLYIPFRGRLFLNYVYAIRALDNGVTMADYLLTHNGFSEKRSSAFII